MKFLATAAFLASLGAALPAVELSASDLSPRQLGSSTRDDLLDGGDCPNAIFIFARGSTERGNLGTLGPDVAAGLERAFPNDIWIQGVGGAYDANLGDNALPDGTTRAAIREMTGLFELASSTCPEAILVAGGYSQGAALAAATIRDLNSSIRDKIVGTVLFGYTKNQQNNGRIPNYPADRTLVFCNVGDLVCEGLLIVAGPHLTYGSDARGPAPEFLVEKINGA